MATTILSSDLAPTFAPMSAPRLLIFGGIALIAGGMLFGDIFAVFVLGGVLLPVGIFLIHYVGLAHSPFSVIGWASVLADSAGALLIIALLGEAWGLWKYFRRSRAYALEPEVIADNSWSQHALLSGGTLLVLLGFLYGAWYAAFDLYPQEKQETAILTSLADQSASDNTPAMNQAVNDYGTLAGAKSVYIAAHSHAIEFGLLAMLL